MTTMGMRGHCHCCLSCDYGCGVWSSECIIDDMSDDMSDVGIIGGIQIVDTYICHIITPEHL